MAIINGKNVLFNPIVHPVDIDQTFNPSSKNAQSGSAVSQGIEKTINNEFSSRQQHEMSQELIDDDPDGIYVSAGAIAKYVDDKTAEGKMELIKTVTIDNEETTTIGISKGDNNKDIRVTRFAILFYTPKSTVSKSLGAANIRVVPDVGSRIYLISTATINAIRTDRENEIWFMGELKNGVWQNVRKLIKNHASRTVSESVEFNFDEEFVQSNRLDAKQLDVTFKTTGNNSFENGTIIKIYGVRE